MKTSLFSVALLAGALVSSAAFAQNTNGNTNSNSNGAIATINNNTNTPSRTKATIRSTVPAYAPGLAVGGIVCEGSTTAALGGTWGGVSFGTTRPNTTCDAREWYKTFASSGMGGAAQAVACDDAIGGKALVNSGYRCPANTVWGAAQAQAEAQAAQAAYYAQAAAPVPVAGRSRPVDPVILPRGTAATYTGVKASAQADVAPMCQSAMTWSAQMCRNARPAS